jgi:hypothetical protein
MDLAEKYVCHTSTINKRARKEQWVRFKYEDTYKEDEMLEGSSGAEDPGEVSAAHRVLWNGVKKRLIKGLKSKDVQQGLDELKVAKVAGEVLSSVVKGEKLAWGIGDVEPVEMDVEAKESEKIISEMDSLTAPPDPGSTLERG